MEIDVLLELGFTQAEARIYLRLLETGPVKVGRIIEKTGLQSSTVHNTMHSLARKGFVSFVKKGKIKVYQAADPKAILENFRDKEKEFENIIPVLKAKQSLVSKQEVEIFEGHKGLMTLMNEIIDNAKPQDIYYFFSTDILNEEIQNFFKKYDLKRRHKVKAVLGLARKELKHLFKVRKWIKMKYVDYPIPSSISICGDKIALFTWEEKPTGVLIKSQQLADSQVAFFKEIWNRT